MGSFLQRVSTWGIRSDTPAEEANYLRLTNVLLLCLFFGSFIETIALFAGGAIQAGLLNSTAPLVFGGGLLLMRSGRTVLARLFVLTISISAGYVLATMLGPEAQIQQLILFSGAVSFTFFTLSQWRYILYGLAIPLVSFLLLEATHYQPVLGLSRETLSERQLLLIRMTSVSLVWTLVLAQIAYHIRERRRSQERLVFSAKMAALGQMAAGIGHEINNPLLMILCETDRMMALAQGGPVAPERAVEVSDRISSITMRIGSIVRGLQTLSRDASGDPFAKVTLLRLVNLTLDYCRARIKAQGVELRIGQIPEGLTAIGREAQLSQVLLNVLNNALDATQSLEERWIEIGVRQDDGMVLIEVTDSGANINSEVRKRLFDPFFTTKPVGKGTGLGLSIARGIMSAHNGQIFYDERSPRTRFVIQVPHGADLVS